jgi:Protein of unknown function (DUF2852)
MSTAQNAFGSHGGRGFVGGDWTNASWRRSGCGATRWSMFEIVAMVLGFIVFWPIGLAILGFKLWQRKSGYSGDLQTAAQAKWREARGMMANSAKASGPWTSQVWSSRRGFAYATGNSAFDDWKNAELARLEEERRKLQDAHNEFAEFLDNIRRAKDREEFERFMNDRRNRQGESSSGTGGATT